MRDEEAGPRPARPVDFDDYEHGPGDCLRGAYAHFTEPRWCGHPLCMFESCGGDLDAVEARLLEQGYDAYQVARMMESYYLPLSEQKSEEELLRGGAGLDAPPPPLTSGGE